MKKMLSGFMTAVFTISAAMLPFWGITASAEENMGETYEDAWFPLRTMALTQIAFDSYSHGNSYHMDCSGRYEQCAFAPFTGKVVYATENYGLVLFQSTAPVHYADGSTDYMTAVFMHADNTDELKEYCENGTVIPQGKDFLRCGGTGKNGEQEYSVHYDIGIYRGQLSAPTGYYSRLGNIYPFEGFYLNPRMTPSIVDMGHLGTDSTLMRGEYDNWDDLWVTLPQQASVSDSGQQQTTKPEQPVLSIQAENSAHPVTISFQQCENTTYYNTRIYDSAHTIVYCVGLCKDAEPFGECRITADTTVTRQLPAGAYQVMVTAVNRETGECTASPMCSFTVERSAQDAASSIVQLQAYFSGNAEPSAAQASVLDMNADGCINAVDLTLWKQQAFEIKEAA